MLSLALGSISPSTALAETTADQATATKAPTGPQIIASEPTQTAESRVAAAEHSGAVVWDDPGCDANNFPANDDSSVGPIALPFALNFFGSSYGTLFVNNNGNVTFTSPLSTFTPFTLTANTPPIIAPFLADVDTRGAGSNTVKFGQVLDAPAFGGRDVFCVNWRDVGYYNSQTDKLNDFQLLLVERNDVDPGDVDVYFNYERVLWETGGASGGVGGFGGNSAGAGYAAGTGSEDSFFELPCSRINGACLDSNFDTGLHNTSTNSLLSGRHIFGLRGGGQTFTGEISGNVSTASGPVEGAFVQVCRQGFPGCTATTVTGPDGNYGTTNLPPGTYNIGVSAPGNLTPQARTVPLADGEQRIENFVLTGPEPPPAGTSIDDDTPPGQIPSVVVGQPVTLETTGHCEGGTATYEITGAAGQVISGSMTEGPPGTYSATFSIPFTGPAVVTITIDCPTDPDVEIEFNIYIDPSGFVRDTDGNPITGATVTLFRSDTEAGPFEQVPDGSAIMSPSNRVNPDTTDATGHFGWDVIAGFYTVRAEAPDCVSPADPSQSFVETPVLTIPPPVTDLDIRLDCDGSPPVVLCEGSTSTIVGTVGPEVIIGTEGDDVISALGGDDEIRGRGGNDIICGDDGNDLILGNLGRDTAYGGTGNDLIRGANGQDTLFGQDGDDQLFGEGSRDSLSGGAGTDRCHGGGGSPDVADATCEAVHGVP